MGPYNDPITTPPVGPPGPDHEDEEDDDGRPQNGHGRPQTHCQFADPIGTAIPRIPIELRFLAPMGWDMGSGVVVVGGRDPKATPDPNSGVFRAKINGFRGVVQPWMAFRVTL